MHNPDGVLYGRLPHFGLSELGHRMARTAADDLLDRRRAITALYASPLQRAQESAQPISQAFELPILVEDRIIEPTNEFEGGRMTGKNSALKNPANWALMRNPLRPSWGEAYTSIAARMYAAIESAWRATDEGDVVLVSHQLPIWTAHRSLAGEKLFHDPRKRRCALSSITTFERRGSTFVEVGYANPAAPLLAGAIDVGAV